MSADQLDFSSLDLFSDEILADPFPIYASIRDAAPAVWLERSRCWAVGRYSDVRRALTRHQIFRSGEGIGLTPEANALQKGSVLSSDPPVHGALRSVLNDRMSPAGLQGEREPIQRAADILIDRLVSRQSFDAVEDLAKAFPVMVVLDLIGIPHAVRPRLLDWADALFNTFGPPNERTMKSLPVLQEFAEYIFNVERETLAAGSLAAALYEARDREVITSHQAAVLLGAYLGAGLDTTINSISAAIYRLATNPDQWQLLREHPDLIPRAYDEVLRIDSPVLAFTRYVAEATDIDGIPIPAGDRVLLLYASANRDPRKWTDPDRFDIRRAPMDHLAFGVGRHLCAGQLLARIEVESLLRALTSRVARIEVGTPAIHLNNVLRGLRSLPVTVHAETTARPLVGQH